MPVAAIAAIGSSVIGGISSSKAAGAQQDAAAQAVAEQRRQFDLTRSDQMPWMQAGQSAIGTLGSMVQPGGDLYKNFTMADYQADPGYAFRLAEGQKALERSAAARGGLLGGGTLRDLTNYSQGAASQEFQNSWNRFQLNRNTRYNQLAGVAGAGQNAANTLASVGQNTAANIGNDLMYAGNARASGYMGIGNAINSGIGNLYDIYNTNRNANSQTKRFF